MAKDIKLICKDCGCTFVFSEGEQKFFESKGFQPPKRCKKCRDYVGPKGIRTSSYFINASLYGPGTSVEGGLSIEYAYYVKVDGQYLAVEDDQVFLTKHKKDCKRFRDRTEARNHIDLLNEDCRNKAKVMVDSHYAGIRG